MTDLDSVRFRLGKHVKFTVIDGTAILLDGRRGKYLGLNEVGTRILQLVDEGREPAEILEVLLGEFDAPEDRVRTDVEKMLHELETNQLIERRAAS